VGFPIFVFLSALSLGAREGCSLEAVPSSDIELNNAISAHDTTTASSIYAHAFVLTTSLGSRKNADDMLRDIGNSDVVLTTNETHDVSVVGDAVADAHTAVLTAKLHQAGTIGGKAFDAELFVTDTWTCDGERWRLLAGHASSAK
jgi:hypothetical protein